MTDTTAAAPLPDSAASPRARAVGRVFERGPFHRLVELFGGADERATVRAAIGLAALAWLPLPLLAALAGGTPGISGVQAYAVLTDYGALARFLIALPLLVVADIVVGARLTGIASYFAESGLVPPEAVDRFDALLESTRAGCASRWAAVAIAVLAFSLATALHEVLPADQFPSWRRMTAGQAMSPAGWWNLAVSVPLLFFFAGGWLWRLLAWTRFLWHAAHLPLRLAAAHPDLAGGLKFVAFSVRDFAPLGMVVGILFAGTAANRVINFGATLASFQTLATGMLAGVLAVFGLPLFAFTGRLLREWTMGVQAYGRLSARLGDVFERKWFSRQAPVDERMLDAGDFSAAVDLSGYSANVYGMHLVPFDLKSFVFLAAATALPMVPVVLFTTPVDVLMKAVAQFMF